MRVKVLCFELGLITLALTRQSVGAMAAFSRLNDVVPQWKAGSLLVSFLFYSACFIAPIDGGGTPCTGQEDCPQAFACHEGFCLNKSSCVLNGIQERGELCDDGNTNPADACTNECKPAVCGDNVVRRDLVPGDEGYENCEPGLDNGRRYCRSDCAIAVRPNRLITASEVSCRLQSAAEGLNQMLCWGKPPVESGVVTNTQTGERREIQFPHAFKLDFEFAPSSLVGLVVYKGTFERRFLYLRSQTGNVLWGNLEGGTGEISRSGVANTQWIAYSDARIDYRSTDVNVNSNGRCYSDPLKGLTCRFEDTSCLPASLRPTDEGGPVSVNLAGAYAVAMSDTASCVLTAQGAVWCFGDLDDYRSTPIAPESCTFDEPRFCDHPRARVCVDGMCAECADAQDCSGTRPYCVDNWCTRAEGSCIGAEPRRMEGLDDVVSLVAHGSAFYALTNEGLVYRWGAVDDVDAGGQAVINVRSPEQVPLPGLANQVSVVLGLACALLDNQKLACWGQRFRDGGSVPHVFEDLEPIVDLGATGTEAQHLCAEADSGTIYCVGNYGAPGMLRDDAQAAETVGLNVVVLE